MAVTRTRTRAKPTTAKQDQTDDENLTPVERLKAKSWNKQVEQATLQSRTINHDKRGSIVRKAADDYLRDASFPTFTGMALALGFSSVKQWEAVMTADRQLIDSGKADSGVVDRYYSWEKARSRVQLHYEEGIQSGVIPAPVGKFVLEVLGFMAPVQQEAKEASAKLAAEATRAGYAMAAKDLARGGKAAAAYAKDAAQLQ